MDEIYQLINGVSGPVPHTTVFFTFACILGWWTKEIKATWIIMILWSIFAECLQSFYPTLFQFSLMDIGWNIIGSTVGIMVTQIALFVCSGWIETAEGWDEIRRNSNYGNYPW